MNSPKLKIFACPQAKKKKDLFVLKQKDIFLFCFAVAINLILILPFLSGIKRFHYYFKCQFLCKNKIWCTSITKFLDKLMYLNSLFNKSFSLCVCRSLILFIFMLNLVNLLGVFLECLSKSHMLVFHIDLH